MSASLLLPAASGALERFALSGRRIEPVPVPAGGFTRIAYSAAHVVADPLRATDLFVTAALDWDATIGYRQHLWSLGLGVAEAMDTAQRGMGLDWPTSLELIRRTLDAARDVPGALVASGCGTDHLAPGDAKTVDDVICAYEEQMAAIEALGGKLIVMASRALVRVATSPADYERVYDRILMQAKQPVVLHWLGDMFDPELAGYWGSDDVSAAMDTALGVIAANPGKVDGIKISLLDKDREVEMRRRLPEGVRMYTGDDFNYAELIAGDGVGTAQNHRHSDALLGIFDAIAPAASAALGALAANDLDRFHAILAPTVPLSRHVFRVPTRFYKTGIVFLAWLNGHQSHFTMVGGQQGARSIGHFAEAFRLADAAGLIEKPDLAVTRMASLLATHGIAAEARWKRSPMRDFSADHRWLSINTATLRGAGGLDAILDACARHGIRAISPWRDQVHALGFEKTQAIVRAHGFALSGYCRGGMFTGTTAAARQAALDDNRRAVDEAKALDAACLVLVVGALPGALAGKVESTDLAAARNDVRDGIAATLEYAKGVGMPLAIEPLHPMYAADRACVNTLAHALDLCDALDPSRSGALGVALDVYHVWWDPELFAQIARAGRERLLAFHVCDWLVPTRDLLEDRGMMGDGVIEIAKIRAAVETQGFAGYSEVEIFSSRDWWKRPADEVLATCIARHRTAV